MLKTNNFNIEDYPKPFFKLRWPIRAHSEYILPRRSEMRAEQAPRGTFLLVLDKWR